MSTTEITAEIVEIVNIVADYMVAGIPTSQIIEVTGLTLDELQEIQNLEIYNSRLRELRAVEVQQQVDRTKFAKSIMTNALSNLNTAIREDVTNAELAMRAALTVDKLARSGAINGKGDLPNVTTPTGTVTLSLPAHMIAVIAGISQEKIINQSAHLANRDKHVGMIGSEALREHMGFAAPINDDEVIDATDFMEVGRL